MCPGFGPMRRMSGQFRDETRGQVRHERRGSKAAVGRMRPMPVRYRCLVSELISCDAPVRKFRPFAVAAGWPCGVLQSEQGLR